MKSKTNQYFETICANAEQEKRVAAEENPEEEKLDDDEEGEVPEDDPDVQDLRWF